MTTPWYESALEAVGFDILLIGSLFILTLFIARRLLARERFGSALAQAWKEFRNFFGLDTNAQSTADTGVLATVKAAGSGVAVLLLAAAAGLTLDGIAHRLLDFSSTPSASASWVDKFECKVKFAWPDDEVKRAAFHSITKYWQAPWGKDVCDTSSKAGNAAGNLKMEQDRAKGLMQVAHFAVLNSDKESIKKELARDQLFLKIFRVLAVLSVLLFIASLLALFKERGSSATPGRAASAPLICLVFSLCFLYLWSQQARHYYKRVFYAYSVIHPEDVAAYFPPPPSHFSNAKDAATLLKAIVKLQEASRSDPDLRAAVKSDERLSSYQFYEGLLTSPQQGTLQVTPAQRRAWLRQWRAALIAADAFDGRRTALVAAAEKYGYTIAKRAARKGCPVCRSVTSLRKFGFSDTSSVPK